MNKKKILTFLMSATMITGTMITPSFAATFNDVDGHWAIGSINRW